MDTKMLCGVTRYHHMYNEDIPDSYWFGFIIEKFTIQADENSLVSIVAWSEHPSRLEPTGRSTENTVDLYARWCFESLLTRTGTSLRPTNGTFDQELPILLLDKTKAKEEEKFNPVTQWICVLLTQNRKITVAGYKLSTYGARWYDVTKVFLKRRWW